MPSINVSGSGSCKAFNLQPKSEDVGKLYNIPGTNKFLGIDAGFIPHIVDFSNASTFAQTTSDYVGINSDDFKIFMRWDSNLPAQGTTPVGSTLLRLLGSDKLVNTRGKSDFNYSETSNKGAVVALSQPETFSTSLSATNVIFTIIIPGTTTAQSFVNSVSALPGFSTPANFYLLDSSYDPDPNNENKTKYVCTSTGLPYDLNNGLPDMTKVVSFPVVSSLGPSGLTSVFQTVSNVFKGPNPALSTIPMSATVSSINTTSNPMSVTVSGVRYDGADYTPSTLTYNLLSVAPTPDPETFKASKVQTIALSQYSDSSAGASWAQVDSLSGTIANGWNKTSDLTPNTTAGVATSLGSIGTNQYVFSIKNSTDKSMTITALGVYCTAAGDPIKFNYYIGDSSIAEELDSRPTSLASFTARFKANTQLTASSVAYPATTQILTAGSSIVIPQGKVLSAFVYGNNTTLIRFTSTDHDGDFKWETNIGSSIGQNIMFRGGPRFATNITNTSIDAATSSGSLDYTHLRFPYINFTANPGGAPYISPSDIKYLGVVGAGTVPNVTYSKFEFKNFFQFVPTTFAQFNIFPLAGGDNARLEDATTVFLMSTFDSAYMLTVNSSGAFTPIKIAGGLFKSGTTDGTTFDTTAYNGGWQFITRTGGGNILAFTYDVKPAAPIKFYLQKDGTLNQTMASALPLQCNYCSPFGMCAV